MATTDSERERALLDLDARARHQVLVADKWGQH